MNEGAKADRPGRVFDYGAFRHPTSPLFRDYLAGQPKALAFYGGGGWDLPALLEASRRALTLERPRDAVASALVRQQEARGAPAAAARAALLRDPRAVAVVTGQQAGLFGGPLYVLYKALAARKVARLLEERRGTPAVAVFWVASDDHDFAEVRATSVIDEAAQIRTLRYSPLEEPVGQPAWMIPIDETMTRLVEELGQALPATPHRDELIGLVGSCYRPGVPFSDAFARLLSSLLPDLVVLDPSDPALKALMVPVLTREIAERSPTSRLALEVGTSLLAAGYHQQVPVRPGFLNLWVLLRPLTQDALLPTAGYVGGPAEIAYHAQIGPSYAHFGIPRPVLLPRPSLTLVEPSQARALEAEGLKLADLETDPEGLVARWAREAYPDVEAAFARAREALEREMDAVEERLAALDPTLRAAADAARGRALHQIETLHEKAVRALKKRDQTRADRLRRTRDALFPGGSFQERGLGLVNLLARHGRSLIDDIEARMDPFAQGHQVLYP